jgi:hypothetical protein
MQVLFLCHSGVFVNRLEPILCISLKIHFQDYCRIIIKFVYNPKR